MQVPMWFEVSRTAIAIQFMNSRSLLHVRRYPRAGCTDSITGVFSWEIDPLVCSWVQMYVNHSVKLGEPLIAYPSALVKKSFRN